MCCVYYVYGLMMYVVVCVLNSYLCIVYIVMGIIMIIDCLCSWLSAYHVLNMYVFCCVYVCDVLYMCLLCLCLVCM